MNEIPRVQIGDLLSQATPHDTWMVPLDHRLRLGFVVSGVGMTVGVIASWMMVGSSFTPLWVSLALLANICGLLLLAAVGFATDGFQAGSLHWHRIGTGLVAFGSADLLVFLAPMWWVILQVLFWIAVLALIGAVILFVLAIGALFS